MSISPGSVGCRFYTKPMSMQKRKMLTGTEKPKKYTYIWYDIEDRGQITTKNVEKTIPILIL
jgi:hypothetical protein